MPYTRTYRTIIPVDPAADIDLLRWLTRESFERKADGDCLRLVDYREETVAPEDIPPKAGKQLTKPISDYMWLQFSGTASA